MRTAGVATPIPVKEGDEVLVCRGQPPAVVASEAPAACFTTNYARFVEEVPVGSRLLIDDGAIAFTVISKTEEHLVLRAENSGVIKDRKSCNTPDVCLDLPSVSQKDADYLEWAAKMDIDFIAHSFVRCRKDVEDVRALLEKHGSSAAIVAKIESRAGVENIDEILEVANGIMVARGDLGIEVEMAEVPMIQKMLIRKCVEAAKPVIVATQMLNSMIVEPRPTRAEVSDVSNAVLDGTDAVMLSGETASGRYPLEAVRTMARIAARAEEERAKLNRVVMRPALCKSTNAMRGFLCSASMHAVQDLPAVRALVCDTLSGRSAHILATYRPCVPIFAQCHDARAARQLALSYGVQADFMPLPPSADALVLNSLRSLLERKKLELGDMVVFLVGTPGNPRGSNIIEINTVEHILQGRCARCGSPSNNL